MSGSAREASLKQANDYCLEAARKLRGSKKEGKAGKC